MIKTKTLLILSSLALMPAISTSALASEVSLDDWSLTGNIALTSDYMFRGYTQTDSDPAIQGGFDVKHNSGFFIGVWASNVEGDTDAPVNYNGANIEIDVYLGWKGKIPNTELEVTARAMRFMYPGTNYNDNNSNEYGLFLNYGFTTVAVNGSINYSDDYYGTGTEWYWDGGVEIPVGPVKLGLHAGRTDYEHGGDYTDYSIAISGELVGLGLSLSYIGTDGVPGGCVNGTCDERAVVTVSKEF